MSMLGKTLQGFNVTFAKEKNHLALKISMTTKNAVQRNACSYKLFNFEKCEDRMIVLAKLSWKFIVISLAHSAVLPYLLPLPLFLEFRGREGWPKKYRGG